MLFLLGIVYMKNMNLSNFFVGRIIQGLKFGEKNDS